MASRRPNPWHVLDTSSASLGVARTRCGQPAVRKRVLDPRKDNSSRVKPDDLYCEVCESKS